MTFTAGSTPEQFVDRYLRVWNEPDPGTRQELVRLLWAPDAVEYTEAQEYRSHQALDDRVSGAYTKFVEEGGYVFRLQADPGAHHGAVLIPVEMVPREGGAPVWTGTIIAFLDDDGRIVREYQFGRDT